MDNHLILLNAPALEDKAAKAAAQAAKAAKEDRIELVIVIGVLLVMAVTIIYKIWYAMRSEKIFEAWKQKYIADCERESNSLEMYHGMMLNNLEKEINETKKRIENLEKRSSDYNQRNMQSKIIPVEPDWLN